MAVVGESRHTRQQIMAFHQPHGAISQHAILAAAASVPYYQSAVVTARDAQPDRPIGYGAFGVVW